jgi:hypothetical protein
MIEWVRRATEYAVGAALVLTHLALSGRMPHLVRALEVEADARRSREHYWN